MRFVCIVCFKNIIPTFIPADNVETTIEPVTGYPTSQPNQPEAALPALLKAGGIAVLAARTEPGHHDAVNVQGDAERETSVSLRDKLELL